MTLFNLRPAHDLHGVVDVEVRLLRLVSANRLRKEEYPLVCTSRPAHRASKLPQHHSVRMFVAESLPHSETPLCQVDDDDFDLNAGQEVLSHHGALVHERDLQDLERFRLFHDCESSVSKLTTKLRPFTWHNNARPRTLKTHLAR